jgi:hypothetical protein
MERLSKDFSQRVIYAVASVVIDGLDDMEKEDIAGGGGSSELTYEVTSYVPVVDAVMPNASNEVGYAAEGGEIEFDLEFYGLPVDQGSLKRMIHDEIEEAIFKDHSE